VDPLPRAADAGRLAETRRQLHLHRAVGGYRRPGRVRGRASRQAGRDDPSARRRTQLPHGRDGALRLTAPAMSNSNRRTFAIISHPDAGKTTLTEKLLL